MKTTASIESVATFLVHDMHAIPASIKPIVAGNVSQAFYYETKAGKFVLRLAHTDQHFLTDKLAYTRFGTMLPIPAITDIGKFNADTFYCVSEFAEGEPSDALSAAQMKEALPNVQHALANIHQADISAAHGYGDANPKTGNAVHATWQEHICNLEETGRFATYENALNLGLPKSLIDDFYQQYRAHREFASETRRLLHGDPGFDNLLVKGQKVTAIIDWAQMGYGDWVSDFARLDFWAPGRYGDMHAFAKQHNLDHHNLNERKALYWAINALWAIEFADTWHSKSVTKWLQDNIFQKLIIS